MAVAVAVAVSTTTVSFAAPAPGDLETFTKSFSSLFGLSSNLTINLKALTRTDGDNSTLGLDYKYERKVVSNLLDRPNTFLDLSARSEGLITLEARKSPHRLLEHGLRLTVANLWPDTFLKGQVADRATALAAALGDMEINWSKQHKIWRDGKTTDAGRAARLEMDKIVGEANSHMGQYVKEHPDVTTYSSIEADDVRRVWYVRDPRGVRADLETVAARSVIYSPLYLAWDVDGNAETDQRFDDIQVVGSTQWRAILKPDWFDKPFQIIRGYRLPRDFRNRNGGPYFYGGAALVDASNNDSREAITGGEDDVFARAHFGVGFRAELLALTEDKVLSLELQWRYYHEFDAPDSIRAADLDNTSYFKATLLFPGDVFLEYIDGKLPLDVEGSSTVNVGWRYNF